MMCSRRLLGGLLFFGALGASPAWADAVYGSKLDCDNMFNSKGTQFKPDAAQQPGDRDPQNRSMEAGADTPGMACPNTAHDHELCQRRQAGQVVGSKCELRGTSPPARKAQVALRNPSGTRRNR